MVILVAELMKPKEKEAIMEQALGQKACVALQTRLGKLYAPDPQRLLYESLKFARASRILQTSAKLRWSNYRVLLRVPTRRARFYYIRQAKNHGWSVGDLKVHVKGRLFEHAQGDSRAPLEELPKGRLYAYRAYDREVNING